MKNQFTFEAEEFEFQPESQELNETFEMFQTEQEDQEWEDERGRYYPGSRSVPSGYYQRRPARPVYSQRRRRPRPRPRPVFIPPLPRPSYGGLVYSPDIYVDDVYSAPVEQGSEQIRRIQSLLNRRAGLRLPENGVMGVETRAAIRDFRRREGLPGSGAIEPPPESAPVESPFAEPEPEPEPQAASDNDAPADQEFDFLVDAINKVTGTASDLMARTRIEDRTASGTKSNRKGNRDIKKVYALVLHQTAFSRGNHSNKYDGVNSHFVILPNGKILQLHPVTALLWSSNGFNAGSVAVEFVGNFPNTKGKCWEAKKFGCHQVTPEQIEAGRFLIRHLIRTIGLTHVLAHRQSNKNRENDPGPDIWYHVGQWAIENLGLKDGGPGFRAGDGNPLPEEWRTWGSRSRELFEGGFVPEWLNEYQNEAGSNSPAYTRWVQQSLNKILGLRLTVDGVNGPQTRSAVRSFQQSRGLVVDGVVGPKTDAAIKQALGEAPAVPSPANANCEILDRFDFDKHQLQPFHQPQLKKVAAQVVASQRTSQPIRRIQITGHTDVAGDDPYNLGLGQRRANEARTGLIAAIEKIKPGASSSVVITTASKGESNPISKDNPRNRRVEICPDKSPIKPPQPKPPVPKPPPCVPPADVNALILLVNNLLRSLPVGMIGVKLPAAARCLTPAEQTFAMGTYAGSLDFTKILIADGLGAQGRPFTVAVPTSIGWHVVMLLGDISRSWVGSGTLIHELAHAWQSQHHGSDPTAYMKNSVECQVRALADIPIAKAAAAADATKIAVASGIFDPVALASIGAAAAGKESSSSYAYVPGKSFGAYAAEQIAQQVEDSFNRAGRPTPGILTVIRSVSANAPSADNRTSLGVISFHRKSTPGVVFH
jgi:peptidoglycan hydrolase-like protein with peptidoglycan-binding domain